jgi:hypothetical protein
MIPFDLHVLSTPPAFVLSQDQTLQQKPIPENHPSKIRTLTKIRVHTNTNQNISTLLSSQRTDTHHPGPLGPVRGCCLHPIPSRSPGVNRSGPREFGRLRRILSPAPPSSFSVPALAGWSESGPPGSATWSPSPTSRCPLLRGLDEVATADTPLSNRLPLSARRAASGGRVGL